MGSIKARGSEENTIKRVEKQQMQKGYKIYKINRKIDERHWEMINTENERDIIVVNREIFKVRNTKEHLNQSKSEQKNNRLQRFLSDVIHHLRTKEK
jgi:signal transduction histidine kinase